jgi:2-polyprenyl-3-methyl-5-hydroxy-6-metoxy-1,4-benzoquinol methylase
MSIWTGKQDAFGKEIYDYLQGKTGVNEIAERDDGDIDLSGGPKPYFLEYEDWTDAEKQAIAFARGRVLDVGCGAGRVALYLQSKGLDVLGIDNSELAVKTCKQRGVKAVQALPVTKIGRRLGIFDTLVMFGNNFGLFENFKRARWLLRRMHGMTSPEARIIASTFDPYQTKDEIHLRYHQRNKAAGRMGGQARIRIRYRDYMTPWFDYLFVSREEMQSIVSGTGWRVERFIDQDFRYFAVLEKEQ